MDLSDLLPGLPESTRYYLKKNAPPKISLKLMQISRWFTFKQFPYMVVKSPTIMSDSEDNSDRWLHFLSIAGSKPQEIDLSNVKNNLWILNSMNANSEDHYTVSRFLSKTVVCDIQDLELGYQHITRDEFKILISSNNVQNFKLFYSCITNDDGSIVPIEKIIQSLPSATLLHLKLGQMMRASLAAETTQNIIDALNASSVKQFCLSNIPEAFDFTLFSTFMEANPSVSFNLHFNITISTAYIDRLQKYYIELLARPQPPQIVLHFPQMIRFELN